MLKNNKVVLFLSPSKVGQAGNFWTLPRTCYFCLILTKLEFFSIGFGDPSPLPNINYQENIFSSSPVIPCRRTDIQA